MEAVRGVLVALCHRSCPLSPAHRCAPHLTAQNAQLRLHVDPGPQQTGAQQHDPRKHGIQTIVHHSVCRHPCPFYAIGTLLLQKVWVLHHLFTIHLKTAAHGRTTSMRAGTLHLLAVPQTLVRI